MTRHFQERSNDGAAGYCGSKSQSVWTFILSSAFFRHKTTPYTLSPCRTWAVRAAQWPRWSSRTVGVLQNRPLQKIFHLHICWRYFLTLPHLLRALLQRLEYFWGTDEYFVCCDLQRCCSLCIIITVFYLILAVISESCHVRNASAELESGVYNTVKLK